MRSALSSRHVAVVAVLSVLVTACAAGGGGAEPADTPATEAGTSTEAESSFPVTLDHKYGSTEIPAEPERVVSVGFSEQDDLLALGVVPVGIRDWYGDQPDAVWPWARDELGDASPTVLSAAEINYEAIAALEPDLIVGVSSGMTEEQYGLLTEIAPTVAQPGDYVDYGTPWREQFRLLASAVGRSDRAETVIADIDTRFAEVRDANPAFEGATAAVAFSFDGSPGAYASQDGRSRLLADLGFVIPDEFDELAGESFFFSVSEEEIGTLDTDVIVWIVSSEAALTELLESPLRPGLDAYAEGREVFADVELSGAFSFNSPLSIPYVLDRLVPELELAVDGDPATEVPSAGTG